MRKIVREITLPRRNPRDVSLSRVMEKAAFNPGCLLSLLNRRRRGTAGELEVSPEKGFYQDPCQFG